MKTKIKTIHEESQPGSDLGVGVLYNYEVDGVWYDTLFFYYKKDIYVFFNTITDLINHVLYGEKDTINSAYVKEELFDQLYDANNIDGSFRDCIVWS
jgi:hypothetical protein